MKDFLARTIAAGDLPLWCPHYFCGSPFLSDIQSGVFYPPSVLLAIFPYPYAFNVFVVFHFLVAFIGCFYFVRAIGFHPVAALFAAISFCWGGYLISSVNTLNNLTTAAWLPALLLAVHTAAAQGWNRGYLMAVPLASTCLMGGEPQLFLMILVLATGHGLSVCPGGIRQHRGHGPRTLLAMGWVTAGAVAICMIQVGPMLVDYRLSARLGGIPYGEATRFSLDWPALMHLMVPLRFGADFVHRPDILTGFFPGSGEMPWLLTIYPGILTIPLAVYGLIRRFSSVSAFWTTALCMSIVLAMGHHTPLYRLVYAVAPFFRFPVKFMLVASFALAILSSAGVDGLIRDAGGRPGIRRLMAAVPVVLFVDLWVAHYHLNPVVPPSFYKQHHSEYAAAFSDTTRHRIYVDPEMPTMASPSLMDSHVRWQMLLLPNLGMLHGFDQVDGKSGLELRYQYFITELLNQPWPRKLTFLRLANVKYILSARRLDTLPALKGQVERIGTNLFRLVGHMPRAWLSGNAVPTGTDGPSLLEGRHDDPGASFFIQDERAAPFHQPYFDPIDQLRYINNHRIQARLTATQPAVMVLSESFYPGWRVRVDGKPQPLLRLNFFFQGVALDKGAHTVTFVYRPPYFYGFAMISVVAIVLWTAVVLKTGCRRQTRPAGRDC